MLAAERQFSTTQSCAFAPARTGLRLLLCSRDLQGGRYLPRLLHLGVYLSVAVKLENPKSPMTPVAPSR